MVRLLGLIVLVATVALVLLVQLGAPKTLSKEELDTLWEEMVRREDYRSIEYHDRGTSSMPTSGTIFEGMISVQEAREVNLWAFFGLSGGGGWEIDGRLEAEVPIEAGLLQLYSKAITYWVPGFLLSGAWYDDTQYPIWEFRLLLRDPVQRQKIQILKRTPIDAGDVILPPPLGERTPRGELRHDAARQVAVVQISGVHHPMSVEVPLSASSPAAEGDKE